MVGGHIREKGGRYHIILTWNKDGKQYSKSMSTKIKVTEPRAKTRAKEMLVEAKMNFQVVKNNNSISNIYVHDYVEKVINNHIIKGNLKEYTIKGLETAKGNFIKMFPNLKIDEITPNILNDFFYEIQAKGKKTHYISLKGVLNIIFKAAIKEDIIESNPLLSPKIEKFSFPKPKIKEIIKKDEIGKFLKIIKLTCPQYFLEYYILITLGLRRGELIALDFDNIDFKEKKINIFKNAIFSYGSGKVTIQIKDYLKTKTSSRVLPLTDDLIFLLKERKKRNSNNAKMWGKGYNKSFKNFVCLEENGDLVNPQTLLHNLKKVGKKLNKNISLHSLRHSLATFLYSNDVNLKDIQHYLGHSNIVITANLYSHYDSSRNINILKKLEKIKK